MRKWRTANRLGDDWSKYCALAADFVGDILANQCRTYGLLQRVPLNATTAGSFSTNNEYKIRSAMTSGLSYGLFTLGDVAQRKTDYRTFSVAEVRDSIRQYVLIQKYFLR